MATDTFKENPKPLFAWIAFGVIILSFIFLCAILGLVVEMKKSSFYGGMEGIGASRATEKSNFFGGQEAPTFYDTSAELALANLGSGGEVLEEYGEKHRKKYGMPVKKAESFNPEKGLYGH